MKRGVNYLLIARGFSEFALAMYTITLPLIILQLTGSLAKSGYFFALITLPSLLGMPFVGPLVERVSRQQMIQICLLLLFTLFGGQLILYHFNLMQLVLLTLIAMVITLISAVSDIATRVIFSELVPATELERYNGLKSLIDNICTFAAPMLGTFIYGLWGSQYVVGLISILLLLALWFVTQMAYTRKITPTQRTETSFGANLKAGITYIKTQKTILRLFLLAMVLNFFVAATDEIINPGIIVAKYGISKQLFGFSATAFITGVILASWLISRRPKIDLHAKLAQLFVINSLIMILIGLSSLLLIHQLGSCFMVSS
ncbi:permease [Agrilactobacillus composti DSM 18527 = JCM 14202]|uniref:MFS transporter n=1 Tax=Agrilactobacillus composti TaxID=398555 RepID=UPI00042E0318|nr:MFS transporter [Agrilactobacillus composti]GAF40688.1 permease [Agrilactobacillus composti DSM 18527 = JCM 14202]